MAAYSMDLHTRVLADRNAGMKSDDVAAKYRVSRAWVNRLVQRRRETGEIGPRPQTTFHGRTLTEQEDRLRALVTAQPDRTLAELREELPTSASLTTIWRALARLKLTVKKTVHADEQRRAAVAAARRHWQDTQPLRDVRQYVFLDECGVTTDLLRRYGRSPGGTADARPHAVQPLADADGHRGLASRWAHYPISCADRRVDRRDVAAPSIRPA